MPIRKAEWQTWKKTNIQSSNLLNENVERAYESLVSERTGIITYMKEYQACNIPLWLCYAKTANFSRYLNFAFSEFSDLLAGAGIGLSQHEARISALGEAVERYAACMFNPEHDLVWASYESVANMALCPTAFTLPSETELKRFPQLARFHSATPIGWAKGRRWPNGEQILAPASFVYANYKFRSRAESFAPGISTGLAAGPTWEQAILSGLCECIERDAFMITYLNRLPVPEIALNNVNSSLVQNLLDRVPPWKQERIRAWNITLDIDVATVVAATIGDGETAPAVAFGAATHVNPEIALYKAIIESMHTSSWLTDKIFNEYKSHDFALDFSDVLTRRDHLGLASQARCLGYLKWLLDDRELVNCESLPNLSGGTPTQELVRLIEIVRQAGLEIAVFDLTTPDVKQAGFYVCRVLVPGQQHLMFGPVRLLGGKRLYNVPWQLGYTEKPTNEASINPIPHPFP
ncbi:MAG: YcaO-like family protein [Ardenticatenaceae bacterium]